MALGVLVSAASLRKNLSYAGQQLGALLGNTSAWVKVLCLVVCCGYGLSYSGRALRALCVTPGHLLPPSFRLWTAFTHCFLELHFWEVCVDLVTLGLCGKLIQPLWGGLEMLVFFALVNVGVAVLSACFYLFLYVCTHDPNLLFRVHIHGLAGYMAAVAVAVRQIMPEHVLVRSPLGKLRNRNVPLGVLLLSVLLWTVGQLDGTHPVMFGSGLLLSWTYLRFYQRHSNGSRGDPAETFAFAGFFPTVMQPPVALVCRALHSLLVKLRLCPRRAPPRKYDVSAPSAITISLPGTDPHDAERRRQIALKALSERLNKLEQQTSWPLLDDSRPPPSPSLSPSPSPPLPISPPPPPAMPTSKLHPESATTKGAKSVTIVVPGDKSYDKPQDVHRTMKP